MDNFKNKQASIIHWALLGAISSNVRLITFKTHENDGITIFCTLETESSDDRSELNNVVNTINSLNENPIKIFLNIDVSTDLISSKSIKNYPIYWRKE